MGGHGRFFMLSSAAFTAQAVSCSGVGQCFAWHRGTRDCVAEKVSGGLHVLGEAEAGAPGQSCRQFGRKKERKNNLKLRREVPINHRDKPQLTVQL